MKKAGPGPRVTNTSPPSAGPKARAALNCAELRVTALRSAPRTNSETNACHAGALIPVMTPPTATRPMITGTEATPVTHAPPIMMAPTPMATWVTSSTRRRSNRSAMVPPNGDIIAMGASWLKAAMPTQVDEWVS